MPINLQKKQPHWAEILYFKGYNKKNKTQTIKPKGLLMKNKIINCNSTDQISSIGITSDKLVSRGGLALILRYLDTIGIRNIIEDKLGHLRFSGKGLSIWAIVRQIVISFIDGSDTTLNGFDKSARSPEYAMLLGNTPQEMITKGRIRRFLSKFIGSRYHLFRPILHKLFIWRLQLLQPEVIMLYIDTEVFDNDGALQREGCKPTYKKKKGFQPLQVHWGPYIVDMEFRSGEKHSNYGNGVSRSIKKLVGLIRTHYRSDVPIIVTCDSGFLSEKNFDMFESLGIHYAGMGKCYDYLYDQVSGLDLGSLPMVEGRKCSWAYCEFGSRFKTGETNRFRRTIFTTVSSEDGQTVLRGTRPDTFIHTNIGTNSLLDKRLRAAGRADLLGVEGIIRLVHSNGLEELNHRSIKEFMGKESLPFKRFGQNAAYYSLMVIAHFLTESFRVDIAKDILPIRCYATKFRRTLIDFAAKIVTKGGCVALKVTHHLFSSLRLDQLWYRCNHPPLPIGFY